MKSKDIRERDTEELKKQIIDLKEDLFRFRFQRSIGQLEQTANLRHTKKNIARIETILNERAMSESKK